MKNIQLFVPKFRKDEIFQHVEECLDKGWTGLGYKTISFENEWKNYTELNYAHFLNSSTSGLHLSLKILKDTNKWQDGDEIITTPLTFVSTNNAIVYENLKPVFADVDEYLCLNPESVLKKITKKTKAVMFVGIGGNAGRLNEIIKICKDYKLKLILDAAHMAGTYIQHEDNVIKHAGHNVDVSIFSFQAVKNLPTADSGLISFNNEDNDNLARKLSWLGIDKDTYNRTNDKGSYKWEYELVDVGYKYHGNSIMASMALVALKYLEDDNKRRREISEIYEKELSEIGLDTIKMSPDTIIPSRHLFQFKTKNRNQFMEKLNGFGIYPGVHYRDNTNYKPFRHSFGTCPNSLTISEELISLPLHLSLTNEDVYYVIEKINKIKNLIL